MRRKFHDEYVDQGSELARAALDRIGALYDIENAIRGQQPAERQAVRQARAGPALEELRQWLDTTLTKIWAIRVRRRDTLCLFALGPALPLS